MATSILPAIDIATYAQSTTGLDAKALSYIRNVFAVLTPSTLDNAFVYLQQTVGLFATHFDVSTLTIIEDVISLLDSGAAKVFVNRKQLAQLQAVKNLDLDRVVLGIAGLGKEEVIDAIAGISIGIYSADVNDAELAEGWLKEYDTERPPVYISFATPNEKDVLEVAKLGGIPVVPSTLLTVNSEQESQLIDVSKLLLANTTSDREDGLLTTLVVDERGVALGLVYSSEKSVSESLRTGRGVYQSRKRGLWYKGESSGDIQELVRIGLDCDQDCLQFVVRQKGRGKVIFLVKTGLITDEFRFLPSRNSDMLWPIQRPGKVATNTSKPKSFGSRRFIHSKTL
jgi:phosphoribosyl-ATP pyrophosphohydrolase/phosphoribosyl-AMP cyclohydrolase/histidinol dehydrogenase